MQLVMAVGGATAAQQGVLWWAATHRTHHGTRIAPGTRTRRATVGSGATWAGSSRREASAPATVGFRTSRGTPSSCGSTASASSRLLVLALVCFGVGGWTCSSEGSSCRPCSCSTGPSRSTPLSHLWGTRRYATGDDSRNNFFLALITLGEGWHNNHHHYPSAACQGFFWWELDNLICRAAGAEVRGPRPRAAAAACPGAGGLRCWSRAAGAPAVKTPKPPRHGSPWLPHHRLLKATNPGRVGTGATPPRSEWRSRFGRWTWAPRAARKRHSPVPGGGRLAGPLNPSAVAPGPGGRSRRHCPGARS